MKLTTRNTENLVRCLASASKEELNQAGRDLKAIGIEAGQPAAVKYACTRLAAVTRSMAKAL